MLMNETSKVTNLTKKAIEYYAEQGLIFPTILENGYRDFSADDIDRLKKISIFRKLGFSTEEVKAVLSDETGDTLQKFSVQKELSVQREQAKKVILDKLGCGKDYAEISADLKAIEQSATIAEKLLDAFPGYYGRFICLHFARFLNEPIITVEQQSAYRDIIEFLDNVPSFRFPEDLQAFLIESTKHISTINIKELIEVTKQSIENPEKFLSENKCILEQYMSFKQSDEYKNSPVCKMQALLKAFNKTSGYYDIFIPAMKKLSASYTDYYTKIEQANEKLLAQYPEIAKLNN
ncbi:MerR family transcriptional regulator [Geosporobacter ferrireducens]|uniref:MerR family transcriptional regulator n=1 Tax=Geosporobacter ferrireducens TaxID=1424294 RepID=UPI00139C8AB6|nr:MerR family transcriptional regulator [Geosporobacter ferrireducens]MTI56659.1 MerR family transcriptional regulator [Geosporobacter ferrireducens]